MRWVSGHKPWDIWSRWPGLQCLMVYCLLLTDITFLMHLFFSYHKYISWVFVLEIFPEVLQNALITKVIDEPMRLIRPLWWNELISAWRESLQLKKKIKYRFPRLNSNGSPVISFPWRLKDYDRSLGPKSAWKSIRSYKRLFRDWKTQAPDTNTSGNLRIIFLDEKKI